MKDADKKRALTIIYTFNWQNLLSKSSSINSIGGAGLKFFAIKFSIHRREKENIDGKIVHIFCAHARKNTFYISC